MRVYFVRHATASSKADWATDDALRPLTRAGRERFTAAADGLVSVGVLHPDLIVSSPLVRARQTAELLGEALTAPVPLAEDERLDTGFTTQDFWAIVADHAQQRAIAIVGHNPSFADVLSEVTGGSSLEVRKGAIALVDIAEPDARTATLLWLAPPALFGASHAE